MKIYVIRANTGQYEDYNTNALYFVRDPELARKLVKKYDAAQEACTEFRRQWDEDNPDGEPWTDENRAVFEAHAESAGHPAFTPWEWTSFSIEEIEEYTP